MANDELTLKFLRRHDISTRLDFEAGEGTEA